MPRRRSQRVFIYPMSDLANRLLAGRLDADEYGYDRLTCADGQSRELWLVNQEHLERLEADRASLHLRYEVYVSEDGEPPKHCTVENLFHGFRLSA